MFCPSFGHMRFAFTASDSLSLQGKQEPPGHDQARHQQQRSLPNARARLSSRPRLSSSARTASITLNSRDSSPEPRPHPRNRGIVATGPRRVRLPLLAPLAGGNGKLRSVIGPAATLAASAQRSARAGGIERLTRPPSSTHPGSGARPNAHQASRAICQWRNARRAARRTAGGTAEAAAMWAAGIIRRMMAVTSSGAGVHHRAESSSSVGALRDLAVVLASSRSAAGKSTRHLTPSHHLPAPGEPRRRCRDSSGGHAAGGLRWVRRDRGVPLRPPASQMSRQVH